MFREMYVWPVQLTAELATTISACSVIPDTVIWRGLVSRLVQLPTSVVQEFADLVLVWATAWPATLRDVRPVAQDGQKFKEYVNPTASMLQ